MNRRIIYVQYTNPAGYPSLEHSALQLAFRNWEVTFLGTGAFGASCLKLASHPLVRMKNFPSFKPGLIQKLSYLIFCVWTVLLTGLLRPRWVYASDPLSCLPGLLVSMIPRIQVVYHEHDSPSPQDLMPLVSWARRVLARRARLCILPNETRADRFACEMNLLNGSRSKVRCVWNCPALKEAEHEPERISEARLTVLYHGSIVPSRLPESVIHALALLPNSVQLKVIGYPTIGHPTYPDRLKMLCERLGLGSRVQFLGTVPTREELLQECRRCNVGLALMPLESEDINEQTMAGASNKPFEYLACGLPVVVSDLAEWKRMYVAPGYGKECRPDDPEDIARTLRWFLDHPEESIAMGRKGRARVLSEWNYDRQFSPVLGELLGKN
jgi:glycosyltransferase involved in cell wall biosynthesis